MFVECPSCRQSVPGDGRFCDQCGGPIRVCPECGTVNTGRYCTNCRTKLIDDSVAAPAVATARGVGVAASPAAGATVATPVAASPGLVGPVTGGGSGAVATSPRELLLINDVHGIRLAVKPGDELGRTVGPHAHVLARLTTISRRHARIEYAEGRGWYVVDLGSSYGTDCRDRPTWTDADYHPTPPDPIPLIDGGYLRLSDVVFRIQIIKPTARSLYQTTRP